LLRKVIESGHSANVARAFGVSKSSVEAYKVGATSTASYGSPDAELVNRNNEVRDAISNKARGRLTAALDNLN